MRKRLSTTTVLLAGTATAALIGGTVGAAAALSSELTVENHLSLDTVDIRIDQTRTEAKTLVAGESYPHLTRISNLGADCYLRVSTRAESEGRSATLTATEESSQGDWVLAGDYLYYVPILGEGQHVDLNQQIFNPWDHIGSPPLPMALTVTAEAVQARNLAPDFTSEDPWGGIEAEECEKSRSQVAQRSEEKTAAQDESSRSAEGGRS